MKLALALQFAGAACLIGGAILIAPWLGLVVAGVCLVAFGVAMERGL